jgi:hypothetical protein
MRKILLLALLAFPTLCNLGQAPNLWFQMPTYQQSKWQMTMDEKFKLVLDETLSGVARFKTIINYNIETKINDSIVLGKILSGNRSQTTRIMCGKDAVFTTIATDALACAASPAIRVTLFGNLRNEKDRPVVLGGARAGLADPDAIGIVYRAHLNTTTRPKASEALPSTLTSKTLPLSGNITIAHFDSVAVAVANGINSIVNSGQTHDDSPVPRTRTFGALDFGNVGYLGPNRPISASYFGAHAIDRNALASYEVNVKCSRGSAILNLSTAGAFANLDGIDALGCGPANTMSTPAAPTVMAVQDGAEINAGLTVAQPASCETVPYHARIFARDTAQGFTASSPEATTTTCSLGQQTATIISAKRSGAVATYNMSAPPALSNNARVCISGTGNDAEFGGCFNKIRVSGSTVQVTSKYSTAYGASTSATGGGRMVWTNCVLITFPPFGTGMWQYFLANGDVSGGEATYGMSLPNVTDGSDPVALQFEDCGPTLSQQALPWFVPSTPPSSPVPDSLITTIISGAGTTTITVATNASSNGSNKMRFDDSPTMTLANNAALATNNGGGMVALDVPTTRTNQNLCYVFSSYVVLSAGVDMASCVEAYDTVHIQSPGFWRGDTNLNAGSWTCPQFALQCHPPFFDNGAYPGVLYTAANGASAVGPAPRGITFESANSRNNGLTFLDANFTAHTFADDVFESGGEYTGIAYYYLVGSSSGGFGFNMENVSFLARGEPNLNSTLSPVCITRNTAELRMNYITMEGRGCFFKANDGGFSLDFSMHEEMQANGQPMLSFYQSQDGIGGWVHIFNTIPDTNGAPSFVSWGNTDNWDVHIDGAFGPASNMPLTSGAGFGILKVDGIPTTTGSGYGIGQNEHLIMHTLGGNTFQTGFLYTFGPTGGVSAGQIANPSTAPIVRVLNSGCNRTVPPSGSYMYTVVYFDVNGNLANLSDMTLQSPRSFSVKLNGTTQCALITQPAKPPVGAVYWWAIRVGSNAPFGAGPPYNWTGSTDSCTLLPITSTTFIDSQLITTGNTCATKSMPNINSSSLQGLGANNAYASTLYATQAIGAVGAFPTLSGTGACTTITTVGGPWAGQITCTGKTGPSTITITPGTTAKHGWKCDATNQTAVTALLQSANNATSCTVSGTVNSNDVIVFSAVTF